MWWVFGSGIAVGLILGGLGSGLWVIPQFMNLLVATVENSAKAIRFPGTNQVQDPIPPPVGADPFADLETDIERVPSWMEEEANVHS